MDLKMIDRKGLIREAYRIEGITESECRSIFLDWALNLPDGQDSSAAITGLLDAYNAMPETHPMTLVLREGLAAKPEAKRRGGRKARLKET
ncbi:hypothetical protein BDE40_1032 [Litoreibacter halocynthiae]|uniref:Uncharacterized protein n=1 Tax=Litoreibacter halocynthiae TaxID=1242689 RepID=A0A4V3EYN8_9RHOB|nr:hypothetical protein [Litoreibacter halocynthiae]TDT77735.1 hypothetical protein BDE40_1032 [Litoreibacter halocynthiae]